MKAVTASEPEARWSNELQKILWKFVDQLPESDAHDGTLSASFETRSIPQPQAMKVQFVCHNALVSSVSIEGNDDEESKAESDDSGSSSGASDSSSAENNSQAISYSLTQVKTMVKTQEFYAT